MTVKRMVTMLVALAGIVQLCVGGSLANDEVRAVKLGKKIDSIAGSIFAEVGVAFMSDDVRTVGLSESMQFPLLSVVKFHQALAVCNELQKYGRTLGDSVVFFCSDMREDTWSPMREKYPDGGVMRIEELLGYSLVMSDNNACDILFNNVAGLGETQEYINTLIKSGCQIKVDEKMMGDDFMLCYENWSTPMAAVRLLARFYGMREKTLFNNVWQMMATCSTGKNRIPRYIDDAKVVHKTGTGPMVGGKIIAVNDIACVELPNGRYFFLAVFIKDAVCDLEECEEVIAQIAKACMGYMRGE